MKNINTIIDEFKTENNTQLVNNCMDILTDEFDGMSIEDAQNWISQLQDHGCVSGMIGALVYYSDTCKFYDDNKDDINTLLYETLQGIDCTAQQLFGDKFDSEDPLCIEETNQNLLAWFAFEETVNKFNDYMENMEEETAE